MRLACLLPSTLRHLDFDSCSLNNRDAPCHMLVDDPLLEFRHEDAMRAVKDEELAAQELEIATREARVHELEHKVAELNVTVERKNVELASQAQEIAARDQDIESKGSIIDSMESENAKLQADLNEMQTSVATLSARIDDLQKVWTALRVNHRFITRTRTLILAHRRHFRCV